MSVPAMLHQHFEKALRLDEPPMRIGDGHALMRWFILVDGSKGGLMGAAGGAKPHTI